MPATIWGATGENVTDAVMAAVALPDKFGVNITAVPAGSKAEQAGLRTGDIIRVFNKIPIDNVYDLKPISAFLPRGAVEIIVWRGGQEVALTSGTSIIKQNSLFKNFRVRAHNGRLHVYVSGGESYELSLYDALGKANFDIRGVGANSYSISHLSAGVYFITMKSLSRNYRHIQRLAIF